MSLPQCWIIKTHSAIPKLNTGGEYRSCNHDSVLEEFALDKAPGTKLIYRMLLPWQPKYKKNHQLLMSLTHWYTGSSITQHCTQKTEFLVFLNDKYQ